MTPRKASNFHIVFLETKATVFGGQKALLARCNILDSMGISYSILHPFPESEFGRQFENGAYKGKLIRPNRRLNRTLQLMWASLHVVRFGRRDECIFHLDAFDSAYLVIFLKMLTLGFRAPTVFTIRSERFLRFGFIDRLLLPKFDAINTNSYWSLDRISVSGSLNKDKVSVCYSPIDFHLINVEDHSNNRETSRVTIGFVGSFEPRKKLDRFIDFSIALARRATNIDFHFNIYGSPKGPQQFVCEQSARTAVEASGYAARFNFMGYREISSIAQSVDLVFCPFENEPFGRVVAELLYAGVPVICMGGSGMAEAGLGRAIELNGYSEHDLQEEFADCVLRFFGDMRPKIDWKTLREELQRKFGAPDVVAREVEIYHKLISVSNVPLN